MAFRITKKSPTLRRLAPVLLVGALLGFPARPSEALDVHLTTDNDFLAENDRDDDLYTFSLAVDVEGRRGTWRLEERAFTDREAGLRFDETSVSFGRHAPASWLGSWSLWAEVGAVHVGEGLLGQSLQNRFHRLIGSDEVFLDYLDDSDLHGLAAVEVDRQWAVRPRLSPGAHVSASAAPGFRSTALVALKGRWFGRRGVQVDFTVGPRFTEVDLALLDAHVEEVAVAATVEAVLWRGLVLQWSTNRYGTGNEHLGLGFRFGPGRSSRRDGPWREAGLH